MKLKMSFFQMVPLFKAVLIKNYDIAHLLLSHKDIDVNIISILFIIFDKVQKSNIFKSFQ